MVEYYEMKRQDFKSWFSAHRMKCLIWRN